MLEWESDGNRLALFPVLRDTLSTKYNRIVARDSSVCTVCKLCCANCELINCASISESFQLNKNSRNASFFKIHYARPFVTCTVQWWIKMFNLQLVLILQFEPIIHLWWLELMWQTLIEAKTYVLAGDTRQLLFSVTLSQPKLSIYRVGQKTGLFLKFVTSVYVDIE